MCSKKEWKATAERRLVENLALRVCLAELEVILSRPSVDRAQATRRMRRALRKIAVAKEIRK